MKLFFTAFGVSRELFTYFRLILSNTAFQQIQILLLYFEIKMITLNLTGENMRKHVNTLVAVLSILVSLNLSTSLINTVYAGAPPLEGCKDRESRPIPTDYDDRLASFAKVIINPSNGGEEYVIKVNPTHYYLSRETQQWLYLRQCAHIQLSHQVMRTTNNETNLREEKEADCWAIRTMLTDRKFYFSERGISKIQRDIEKLERDRQRWQEIFGGLRRRVYTNECLRK